MKNSIILFIGLLLLNCGFASSFNDEARNNLAEDNSISIFCTPDLYNLTATWADEFYHLNPDVYFKIINVDESSFAENLNISRNVGFISSEYRGMIDKSTWKIVVGRDVIVPIFNSKNPFVNEICQQGISSEGFAQIIKNPEMKHWGTLLNNQKNDPVNFYMIDEESINSGMAKWLKLDQITIDGIKKLKNGKAVISSVQKDPYSIGLCKITNITDLNNQYNVESIKLLPIDRNSNGKIDYTEKIPDDFNILSGGTWIGKFPNALINNLYFISSVKPTNENELAFIRWVLTGGQQFLDHYGHSHLAYSERQTKVNLLSPNKLNLITPVENYASLKWVLIILVSFVAIVLTMIFFNLRRMNYIINNKADVQDTAFVKTQAFNEQVVDIPIGLYYDKTHTWAYMEKDGMVRIGIDDFLQHITGPITRVKMKSTGEKIRKGKQVLSIIQKGKQLDIHAPVSGTIKKQNKALTKSSSLINSSPYSDGWVYMIEPTNWIKEIQYLITGKKYKEWLKSEFSRLKDFLAVSVKPNVEYAHILQDGGELKDGILEDLGPEVWEDFQTNFIDISI
jgi:glycine cleavage system H lipoate-binding protein/ABC-type phosphate transport system substrate-binding protein